MKIYKLYRSVYGLNEGSRSWNKRDDELIKMFDFDQNFKKTCVYKKI